MKLPKQKTKKKKQKNFSFKTNEFKKMWVKKK